MKRLRDWEHRLAVLFAARAQDSFEWGRNDCALFAADAVLAVTGVDPAADYRGTYSDERGALRLVVENSMEEFADRFLVRLPAVALACVGDIGLVTIPETQLEAFAVHGGGGWYVPAARGLAMYDAARIAWGVAD